MTAGTVARLAVPGLRSVPPEALHVTLCFLGSRPVADVPAIAAAVEEAAGEPGLRPVTLRPAGALWLPRRRPRTLAVRLDDGDGGAARLHATLAARLVAGGWYAPERRAFLPHVTLARIRGGGGSPANPSGGGLPAEPFGAELGPEPFTAEQVILFRSRLGPTGARYEALCTVSLAF